MMSCSYASSLLWVTCLLFICGYAFSDTGKICLRKFIWLAIIKSLLFGTTLLLSICFHSVSESMCTVQYIFWFLLEDVSLFYGLVTLINFLYYAHILKVTLDNFLLILRMMICLTIEFIGRLPMPLVSLISLKLNWFRSQTCLHVLVSLLAILFKIIFILIDASRRSALLFSLLE